MGQLLRGGFDVELDTELGEAQCSNVFSPSKMHLTLPDVRRQVVQKGADRYVGGYDPVLDLGARPRGTRDGPALYGTARGYAEADQPNQRQRTDPRAHGANLAGTARAAKRTTPRGVNALALDGLERRRDAHFVRLTVNGRTENVPDGLSVRGLVEHLGLTEGPVAVERNREIVPRAEHPSTLLDDGDVIEIVHFVGGG
jgi:sulfur carrier protein